MKYSLFIAVLFFTHCFYSQKLESFNKVLEFNDSIYSFQKALITCDNENGDFKNSNIVCWNVLPLKFYDSIYKSGSVVKSTKTVKKIFNIDSIVIPSNTTVLYTGLGVMSEVGQNNFFDGISFRLNSKYYNSDTVIFDFYYLQPNDRFKNLNHRFEPKVYFSNENQIGTKQGKLKLKSIQPINSKISTNSNGLTHVQYSFLVNSEIKKMNWIYMAETEKENNKYTSLGIFLPNDLGKYNFELDLNTFVFETNSFELSNLELTKLKLLISKNGVNSKYLIQQCVSDKETSFEYSIFLSNCRANYIYNFLLMNGIEKDKIEFESIKFSSNQIKLICDNPN